MPNLSNSRFFRWQFSLRAMLLVMALVSVGIAIYRWPWTIETGTTVRLTTRYHFAWNGQPVKHGLEVEQIEHVRWERYFQEGELLQERFLRDGVLWSEKNWRDGKLHGPWLSDDGQWRTEGEYDRDLMQGTWKHSRPGVVSRAEYQRGEKHGRWEWTTPTGRVLQSAEYAHDRLVKWNERFVTEELDRWIETNVPAAEQRAALQLPVSGPHDIWSETGSFGEVVFTTGRPLRVLAVQRPQSFLYEVPSARVGKTLGEALLAEALASSLTFAFRFNTLHTVPITAASLDWQDRTGVGEVQFDPNSLQAQAWLQAVSPGFLNVRPAERFRDIFQPQSQTGIAIDITDAKSDFEYYGGITHGNILPRSYPPIARRDLLGLHLDREGCYCEQQGDTLIIKRRESSETGTR